MRRHNVRESGVEDGEGVLVTREGEIGEREGCDGEGIGRTYFEPGEELWRLGFRWELLALKKLPWVGVITVFCFEMNLLLRF